MLEGSPSYRVSIPLKVLTTPATLPRTTSAFVKRIVVDNYEKIEGKSSTKSMNECDKKNERNEKQ